MLGATTLGIVGVMLTLICFLIKLSNLKSFGIPYLTPLAPTFKEGLKNSIIKFPIKKLKKREPYLSNNLNKEA